MAYYKTTFTIEVLSEDPLPDCMSVQQIDWAITDGNCVGRLAEKASKELTSKEAATELYEFGSEPSFFNLTDTGDCLGDQVCSECGEPMYFDENDVSHHGEPGDTDFEADADHVALA